MLRFLFNIWLLPIFGMMFAAEATVDLGTDPGGGDPGGGGGDPDPGGDFDPDGGGDPNLNDNPDEDPDPDGGGGDPDLNADPDTSRDLTDGRNVSAEDKQLISAAQKLGPKALKRQKQLIFAEQRLLRAIPGGVNGAIELAQTIDQVGGVEGIEALQSDLQTYTADSELFESNQPKWVENAFTENAEAALKAFVYSLDYVAEHHPENYDHLMAKVIVNDLASIDVHGMYDVLASLKDNPKAAQLAKQLADYYNSRSNTAKKVPEKKPDQQNKVLTDRERKVEEREMGVRFTEVNREVFPALKTSVTSALQAEAKAAGVDLAKIQKDYPGEFRDLLNDIHQRIMKEAQKDQRFLDKHYALVKKGDLKRAAQAVNQKHDRIIQNTNLVKDAMAGRGLFRGKKAAAGDKGKDNKGNPGGGNANANANQGWQRVSTRPGQSSINWSKTTTAMQLDGKYILNDGKKVVVAY